LIPYWFWFLTATVGLGSIAISSFVVVFMRIEEIDRYEHERLVAQRDAHRSISS
jgi:hypothetical protein